MYLLMVDTVGPAANALWATTGRAGLDDQDWDRVKQTTARLRESADLVSFGGTTSKDIERARSNAWKIWAGKFSDTVSLAANAAARKDKTALVAAADDLVGVCQGCHAVFPQVAQ
jgi:hypothetical protein